MRESLAVNGPLARPSGPVTRLLPTVAVAGLLCASLLAAAGCTSEQVYRSAQAWQQNQCEKNIDGAERARCLQSAGPGYDSYIRQTGSGVADR
jgi:hypothetical protein